MPSRRPGGVPIRERGPGWTYRPDAEPPSLFGAHQPGIATPRLPALRFAAFDLRDRAADVLRAWTTEGEALVSDDLTVTLGLGPGAVGTGSRPVRLHALPAFEGDALDPAWSGGDLAVQICAREPGEADAALARLTRAVAGAVSPRWQEAGALGHDPRDGRGSSPRDPLGFRDGTHNLRRPRDLDRYVWVERGDRAAMTGGTYLVVRRIELRLDAWHALPVADQEAIIGRHRESGAPPGGRREFDPAPLEAFPPGSHVRLASPRSGPSPPILRRSYGFDGGLLFLAFMRDPMRQFVPVQRRLAAHDALSGYARHTGSAVFAIPPGARPGGFVGEGLA
jgi:deferrochelatase/peroxidase EfeB